MPTHAQQLGSKMVATKERGMSIATSMSRRSALAGLALASTAAIPTAAIAGAISPAMSAAIDRYRAARAADGDAYLAWDNAESEVFPEFGRRPSEMIRWREYHIGATELEQTRDIMISMGRDRAVI